MGIEGLCPFKESKRYLTSTYLRTNNPRQPLRIKNAARLRYGKKRQVVDALCRETRASGRLALRVVCWG